MKENVVGELGQLGPDDETKQKMLDILKRFHSEEEETDDMDDDDNAGSALSEETIQKVLSGGEVSLDDLSTEEKKLFQRAVVSGELSKMIKPWDPWWLKPSARTISFSKEGSQLIQPLVKDDESMSPEDNSESNQASEIPPGPDTPLPPVSKLSSTKPSPSLAVHLVDIIYSYCFTLRLYNGDWKSDAIGSSVAVLSVSNVLGQGGQPETVLEVLSYCLEKTCSPDFKHTGGLQFGLGLIDDVTSLLMLGTPALLCLLCDLQRMVQAGERDLKSEKPRKLSRRTEIRNKLKLAERKIYFIMCWVHEQTGEVWTPLAAIVTAEKSSALSYQSASRPGKAEKKAEPKSKVLIQEIR
nr:zinc finger HIT domain-containing protein 2 isoform X2 [Malus domestica]